MKRQPTIAYRSPGLRCERHKDIGITFCNLCVVEQERAEVEKLRGALKTARDAIQSLPVEALGEASDGMMRWPIRDELVDKMTKALDE